LTDCAFEPWETRVSGRRDRRVQRRHAPQCGSPREARARSPRSGICWRPHHCNVARLWRREQAQARCRPVGSQRRAAMWLALETRARPCRPPVRSWRHRRNVARLRRREQADAVVQPVPVDAPAAMWPVGGRPEHLHYHREPDGAYPPAMWPVRLRPDDFVLRAIAMELVGIGRRVGHCLLVKMQGASDG
jgi:hypothetical protein